MLTYSIAAPLYLPLRGSPANSTWSPLLETRRSGTGDQGVRVIEWGWLSYRGRRPTARTDLPAPRVQPTTDNLHECQSREF